MTSSGGTATGGGAHSTPLGGSCETVFAGQGRALGGSAGFDPMDDLRLPQGSSARQACVLIADEDEDHLRRHGWRTRERHGHGVLSPYVDELAGVLFFETWIGDKIGMPYTAQGW